MPLNYIDLFAGCGGLSLGLYNADWHGLFAIEKNADAFSTLSANLIAKKKHYSWPEWLPQKNLDIYEVIDTNSKELRELRGQVSLVVGGPPCQGFSLAGRRKPDDARNELFSAYLDFIRLVQPDTLLFENVHGFTVAFADKDGKKNDAYSKRITDALKKEGYATDSRLIDVSAYGVPQKRKRFILVASKIFQPDTFFDLLENNKSSFLKKRGLTSPVAIEDAIGDLLMSNGTKECPDFSGFKSGTYGKAKSSYEKYMRQGISGEIPNSHRFAKHKASTIEIFQKMMNASEKTQRYTPATFDGLKKRSITVVKAGTVCPTVTSIPDDLLHFSEPRIPTVREVARIQSFPDWYEFKGKYTTGGERRKIDVPRYTQVANAVPPLFAEQIGIVLKELIQNGGNITLQG
jgi:DNA (cytosine-5)-methyltransferase 1